MGSQRSEAHPEFSGDCLVRQTTRGKFADADLFRREPRGCFLSVGFHEVVPFLLLARFA